jgi:hypothetical protein
VYAFDNTGRARSVACLGLPVLRPGVRLAHVIVHSGTAVAHEDAREPFGPAPGTGVHAVSASASVIGITGSYYSCMLEGPSCSPCVLYASSIRPNMGGAMKSSVALGVRVFKLSHK